MNIRVITFLALFLFLGSLTSHAQVNCDTICCPGGPQWTFDGEMGDLPPFMTLTNGGWEAYTGTPSYVEQGCHSPLTSISLWSSTFINPPDHAVLTQSGIAGPVVLFEEGKTYCIELCMRVESDFNAELTLLAGLTNMIGITPSFNISDGWQTVSITWTSNNNYTEFSIANNYSSPIDVPVNILFDDVCISEIVASNNCDANFSFDVLDCGEVCFIPETCGDILSFLWTFSGAGIPGGSQSSTQEDPCYVFPGPGTYSVDLVVTCGDGSMVTVSDMVTIPPFPDPPFIACPSDITITGMTVNDSCEAIYTVPSIPHGNGTLSCTIDGIPVNAGNDVHLGSGIHTVVCIVTGACDQIAECVYNINVECEDMEKYDCPIDVLFIMDNSGSISNTDFNNMATSAINEINPLGVLYTNSKFAVAHYSGPCGEDLAIEYDFSPYTSITSINRQFSTIYPGIMDDLNEALDATINALNCTPDPDIVSPINCFTRTPGSDLYIVIFSDGWGNSSLAPGGCTNSALKPYTNSNILKNSFNANITVVHFIPDAFNDPVCGAIASAGGFYNGPVETNPGDPQNAARPRQYIPSSFGAPTIGLIDVIPPCGICYDCDSLLVDETLVNADSCCYSIDITNNVGPQFVKLEARIITPDWQFNTTATNPGVGFLWYPGSVPTANNVCLTGSGNVIPSGFSSDALKYCFSPAVSSPTPGQTVVFNWYTALSDSTFELQCTDTIHTECSPY